MEEGLENIVNRLNNEFPDDGKFWLRATLKKYRIDELKSFVCRIRYKPDWKIIPYKINIMIGERDNYLCDDEIGIEYNLNFKSYHNKIIKDYLQKLTRKHNLVEVYTTYTI